MRNLIKKILRESSDLDWIKDIPGEEGYGEKYRFFDIHVCFSEYDDEYGCYDGYSAFIKIPKYEVDGKWKGKAGMRLVVTKWAIENEQFDSEDYSSIEYVREIDKDEYLKATGDPDLINESSDLDWIKDVESNPLSINNFVVIWIDRHITVEDKRIIGQWWKEVTGDYEPEFNDLRFNIGDYFRLDIETNRFGFGSSKNVFYKAITNHDEYTQYNLSELIPNKHIKESEEDDFKWIKDIQTIGDGWDIYNNKLTDQSFKIIIKPELMTNVCADEYLPDDIDYKSEVDVLVVATKTNAHIKINDCNSRRVEGLLLKFEGTYGGHDGTDDDFTYEQNGEISKLCNDKCWWVYPGVFNIKY